MEDDGASDEDLGPQSREPSVEDLANLCACLNRLGARYVVIGGFAIRAAGYTRTTGDIDLIVDTDLQNEAKVFEALRSLPDRAVDELDAGDVAKYTVVRVADEIIVDLLRSAGGIDYQEAAQDIIVYKAGDIEIPVASPRLLWRMKRVTHREKDTPDLVFLRQWFQARGETPPE